MTSGRSTVLGSRRVAVRDGRRPAGRRAPGARPACAAWGSLPAWALLVAAGILAVASCEDARRGVELIAAIDSLHPGSRIAVEERVAEGVRTVEVTIDRRAMPADVAELDAAARRVARAMRDHAHLRRALDTVVVVYRSEGSAGFLSSSRRARFTYRVGELGAEKGATR